MTYVIEIRVPTQPKEELDDLLHHIRQLLVSDEIMTVYTVYEDHEWVQPKNKEHNPQ